MSSGDFTGTEGRGRAQLGAVGSEQQQGLRAHRCSTASEPMARSSSVRKPGTCTTNTLPLSVPR